jgi:hypothetical protein
MDADEPTIASDTAVVPASQRKPRQSLVIASNVFPMRTSAGGRPPRLAHMARGKQKQATDYYRKAIAASSISAAVAAKAITNRCSDRPGRSLK